MESTEDCERPLTLAMSERWSKECKPYEIDRYNKWSHFHETEESSIGELNETLTIMRRYIAENSDVIICIGGKSHIDSDQKAGITDECEIALENNIPVVVIPFYGGDAKTLTSRYKNDQRVVVIDSSNFTSITQGVSKTIEAVDDFINKANGALTLT